MKEERLEIAVRLALMVEHASRERVPHAFDIVILQAKQLRQSVIQWPSEEAFTHSNAGVDSMTTSQCCGEIKRSPSLRKIDSNTAARVKSKAKRPLFSTRRGYRELS